MSKALTKPQQSSGGQVANIKPPRLPYHPAIEERFGVGLTEWRALVESIFPNAESTDSVILALSYCKARGLDVFKRVVHIVPIWSTAAKRMIDSVWPGIGELRTTACRTGAFAGREDTNFGPVKTEKVGKVEVTYPEFAQVTLYRIVQGQRVAFIGPKVWWRETYATAGRDDNSPNAMWKRKPFYMIDKCAEAAALRAAFPEEIGGEFIPEEIAPYGHDSRRGIVTSQPLESITRTFATEALPAPAEAEESEPEPPRETAKRDTLLPPDADEQAAISAAERGDAYEE